MDNAPLMVKGVDDSLNLYIHLLEGGIFPDHTAPCFVMERVGVGVLIRIPRQVVEVDVDHCRKGLAFLEVEAGRVVFPRGVALLFDLQVVGHCNEEEVDVNLGLLLESLENMDCQVFLAQSCCIVLLLLFQRVSGLL